MGRGDAVELARRAGCLLALVPSMVDGWASARMALPPAAVADADLAVTRLLAVVEAEIDRLYLRAFTAAQSRIGMATADRGHQPTGQMATRRRSPRSPPSWRAAGWDDGRPSFAGRAVIYKPVPY